MDAAALTLFVDAYWTSPFDFSCFVALREKGLEFSISRAVIRSGAGFPTPFVERTLVARVPALAHGDFWLSESAAVIEYLEEAFLAPGWPSLWPDGLEARARARQIISFVRSELGSLRRERPSELIFYPPGERRPCPPLSPNARLEADELVAVAGRILAAGEVRRWPIAAADLAFALLRLVRSDEPVPPELRRFVDDVCERPSVHEFLHHPRPPNPPGDGR
jgi:glutathione S-transferase